MNCHLCKHPTPIVENDPELLCKWHRDKENKIIKRGEGIKKESEKRKVQNKHYAKLAKEFKRLHAICQAQLQGCTKITTECHHAAGRIGDNLTDSSKFVALCSSCHRLIENSPVFAKAMGLSISRLNKEEA